MSTIPPSTRPSRPAGESSDQSSGPSAQPPRLLDRVRHALQIRHYSPRTTEAYVGWIRRFIFFHQLRHPAEMGAPEIEAFLSSLATVHRVSASTQNQALNALVFLYRWVLDRDVPELTSLVRAKRPQRIPVVLSRAEVRALLARLDGVPLRVACLLYGAGLRLFEAIGLRVKDLDFDAREMRLRDGKGRRIASRLFRHPSSSRSSLT